MNDDRFGSPVGGGGVMNVNHAEVVDSIVRLERYLIRHPEDARSNGGGNCVSLPFRCGLCSQQRFDFEMIDGDGLPICVACIDGFVEILSGSK